MSSPPSPSRRPRRNIPPRLYVCFAAILFVFAMVAVRWNQVTGFTGLIQFGDDWKAKRLPVLKDTLVATVPDGGYDGQFYAQIAVEPHVTSPDLQNALDDPAYRSRRILLPLVAHVLGHGEPFDILQVYAMLNFICWLALARIWWNEVGATEKHGAFVWLACLLSLGALDSVRLSLTDLPATLALVLAARAAQSSRPHLAALWCLLGGFIRETSVFGAMMINSNKVGTPSKSWLLRGACVLPPVLWCAWLAWKIPGDSELGLFNWPGLGFAQQIVKCADELAHGHFDSRYLFGLIGALGMAYQSIYLLRRWREKDAWIRLGLPFAIMFWFLGAYAFSGYWAVARACLPMTFAFNRLLPGDRRFWLSFIAGNLFALHGIWRMLQ
jgi:hypothetical protein